MLRTAENFDQSFEATWRVDVRSDEDSVGYSPDPSSLSRVLDSANYSRDSRRPSGTETHSHRPAVIVAEP